MERGKNRELVRVLSLTYTPTELHALMTRLYGVSTTAGIPAPTALSSEEYALGVVQYMERRGLELSILTNELGAVQQRAEAETAPLTSGASRRGFLAMAAALGTGAVAMLAVFRRSDVVRVEGNENIVVQADGSTVTVVEGRPSIDRAKSLVFTPEVTGDLIPGRRGGRGSRYASGRLYQFTLANISEDCIVVVEDVRLEVLAEVEDMNPMMEATTADNHYEVIISPGDSGKLLPLIPLSGAPKASFGYHFTPLSDPDRFSVHLVPSEWGTSYAIRFVIDWYDPATATRYKVHSPVFAAFFPGGSASPFVGEYRRADPRFRKRQMATWSRELGHEVTW